MSVRWSYNRFLNYFISLCYCDGENDVDVSELLNPGDDGFVQDQVFLLQIAEEVMSEQDSMAEILEKIAFFCLLRCAWGE
jgi:hypothetical protein